MKTFARIEHNVVVELLSTATDPATLFNAGLHWMEVTTPGTQIGWTVAASGFTAPAAAARAAPLSLSLVQLQAELNALIEKFAAFTAKSGA